MNSIATQKTDRISRNHLVIFFLLAYGITWGPSAAASANFLPFTVPPLLMSGSAILLHYSPSIAAVIMVWSTGRGSGVRALLGKLGRWRAGLGWYLVIFLLPVVLRLAAVGIDVWLGGKLPAFFSS
jgi:hypothetical protein